MIRGNNIQNQVATALGISFSEVNSSVSVSNVSDTQIIRISATTTDPELSKQIVDQVVTTFTTEASETLNINNIAVIDEATVPTSPVSPNLNMNIIIGALVGGVLCVGYIFIRFMMDTRIHNKEKLRNIWISHVWDRSLTLIKQVMIYAVCGYTWTLCLGYR